MRTPKSQATVNPKASRLSKYKKRVTDMCQRCKGSRQDKAPDLVHGQPRAQLNGNRMRMLISICIYTPGSARCQDLQRVTARFSQTAAGEEVRMAGSNGTAHQDTGAPPHDIDSLLDEAEIPPPGPAPTPSPVVDPPHVPPLPAAAQCNPQLGKGTGCLLDTYLTYAAKVTPMTPASFHTGAILGLAAILIARRVVLRMAFGDIYPNLYILWIAQTTLWQKTTALNIARKLFRAVRAPPPPGRRDDTGGAAGRTQWPRTHEPRTAAGCRTRSLAEGTRSRRPTRRDPGRTERAFGQHQQGYNAGLIEAFLRFYDCDIRSSAGLRAARGYSSSATPI